MIGWSTAACLPLSRAGFVHSRPEALYFWLYFVIINAFWIVIPSAVIVHAWAKISAAVGSGPAAGQKKVRGRPC